MAAAMQPLARRPMTVIVRRRCSTARYGLLSCGACGRSYQYSPYGESIAIYADPPTESQAGYERAHLELMEEAPPRSGGFIMSAGSYESAHINRCA
jgi:hypothetical protein